MTREDPVWQLLKDAPLQEHHFRRVWFRLRFSKFMEELAVRLLHQKILADRILDNVFSDKIVRVHFAYPDPQSPICRNRNGKIMARGISPDLLVLCDCELPRNKHCKKAIAYEVKIGVTQIQAPQLNLYMDFIQNPQKFVPKAQEAKVFYFWITGMDLTSCNIYFTLKEMTVEEVRLRRTLDRMEGK
jgi:hypothetical protein